MDIRFSDEDEAFAEEVRRFFAENLTDEIRRAGQGMTSVYAHPDAQIAWQKIVHQRGWAAPAWPVEFGGCGWSPVQRYIYSREEAAAGAPPLTPMGIRLCAPALIQAGTPAQQARFLPRMLSGEDFWCQGYSEPGSGSDLASLQMVAVEDGDDFICTGTKIWTTHAAWANWMFCLVRTSEGRRPQEGITFLLIDMKSPRIRVEPITMIAGEAIQCRVHFDAVRVPKSNVVGEIGKGWNVTKYTLAFERGGQAFSPELEHWLDRIEADVAMWTADGQPLSRDPLFAAAIAQVRMEIDTLASYELRVMSAASRGQDPGAAASVMKILGTELLQRLSEIALEAAGPLGLAYQPVAGVPGGPIAGYEPPADGYIACPVWAALAPLRYLNMRTASIYAGSNEIQRNILAKMTLDL